ncbi:MAG: ABC transporter ATP-binding protein [Acidimicrobiales bacterium]
MTGSVTSPVISVVGLRKSYGDREAVRGLDLEVGQGEIVAVLGPNGAGKTTTVEILEGYRDRSAGQVEVLGVDPAKPTRAWRSRIGVVLQSCMIEPLLTVEESLRLYAGYYSAPRPVDEVVELVGLGEQRRQRAGKLSGGQQRRLDVALAIIGDPELLFLDEPTTGFDPAARRAAWGMIANLRQLGKTVLLTTHYLDEAEALADRVVIVKDGRVVAEGAPGQLAGGEGTGARIAFRMAEPSGGSALPPVFDRASRVGADGYELTTADTVADLAELCSWAVAAGVDLVALKVARPSLEDVYLELTGDPTEREVA